MGSMSFVMQMYVCVLCASCGSSQCGILHDLQFINDHTYALLFEYTHIRIFRPFCLLHVC